MRAFAEILDYSAAGDDHPGRPIVVPHGTGNHRVTLTERANGDQAHVEFGTPLASAGIALGYRTAPFDPAVDYLMVPGAVYAANAFPVLRAEYPPRFPEDLSRPHCQPLISDVPRLTRENPLLELRAGDMAQPAVGVWFRSEQRACFWRFPAWIAAVGETGIRAELTADGILEIRFLAPGVRSTRYRHMTTGAVSPDTGAGVGRGETLDLEVTRMVMPCDSMETFWSIYWETIPLHSRWKTLRPAADVSAVAWALIEEKFHRENWWEETGLFATVPGFRQHRNPYQTGWVGGGITAWAFLHGPSQPLTRQRAFRHFQTVFTRGIHPNGLFIGKCNSSGKWTSDCAYETDRFAYRQPATLTRRQGDALWYGFKALDVALSVPAEASDAGAHLPTWEQALRSNAECLCRIWRKFGEFGFNLHQETADVLVGNSASGALIPGALVRAFLRWGDPEFLSVARAAARHFNAHFLDRGICTGGPGDALHCPDSESNCGLLISLIELDRLEPENGWLDAATLAARLLSSWVMDEDYNFPENTTFGRLGMKTTGTVFANVQNKHSAPGLCTYSGVELASLAKRTGDGRYKALQQAICDALPQFLSTADRPVSAWNGMVLPPGWMHERVNTSDWEDKLGEVLPASCWCETSLLLSVAENQ